MIGRLQKKVQSLAKRFTKDDHSELLFIIFVFFLLSFLFSRILAWLILTERLPIWLLMEIKDYHIHHFVYGIVILSIAGLWAILRKSDEYLHWIATLYGIGLGVSFDEFGMWFLFQENYWLRLSYDATITASLIFLNAIFFKDFWNKLGRGLFNKFILPYFKKK